MCIIWMLEGRSILGVRGNRAHIRQSLFSKITKGINTLGLQDHFVISQNLTIKCKSSRGSMVFVGAYEPEKVKGVEAMNAEYIDTVIYEEATELSEIQFDTVDESVRGGDDDEDPDFVPEFPIRSILLFNPINRNSWIYKRYFAPIEAHHDFNTGRNCLFYEDDDIIIHKTTYEDNRYTRKGYAKRFALLKERNIRQYGVRALGNFGINGKLVYENVHIVKSLPENLQGYVLRMGIDNAVNDAQVFVISYVNFKERRIYIVDEVSDRNVGDMAIWAEKVKAKMKAHNIPIRTEIMIDPSPKIYSITFNKCGLNTRPCSKPAGSVNDRHTFLGEFEINILSKCKETANSLAIYSYVKDSHGNYTDKVHHDGKDEADAFGYGYEKDYLNKGNMTIFTSKYI